jgi:hypothetical protein
MLRFLPCPHQLQLANGDQNMQQASSPAAGVDLETATSFGNVPRPFSFSRKGRPLKAPPGQEGIFPQFYKGSGDA